MAKLTEKVSVPVGFKIEKDKEDIPQCPCCCWPVQNRQWMFVESMEFLGDGVRMLINCDHCGSDIDLTIKVEGE